MQGPGPGSGDTLISTDHLRGMTSPPCSGIRRHRWGNHQPSERETEMTGMVNLLVTVADLRSGSGSDGIGDQEFAAAEGHAIGAVVSEGREDAPVLNGVGVLLIKFDGGEVGGGEVECGGGHVLCLI